MAARIQINQVGIAAGEPGVAREDGLSTGALVTLLSLAHESTFEFALLWTGQHPTPDTTSVASLQAAGVNAVSFSPTAGVYGTWRIELVTDRGTSKEDRAELAFAIKSSPTALRIPAANERSDPSASLVNHGASYIARATFNAPDGIANSPFSAGTYVSWWRSIADLIHAVNTGGGGGGGATVGVTCIADLLTGSNDNIDPSPDLNTCTAMVVTAASGAQLTGLRAAGTSDPFYLRWVNGSAVSVTLKNESGSSSADNRLHTSTGADVVATAGSAKDLIWFPAAYAPGGLARWYVY